jgi:hypothetical protein
LACTSSFSMPMIHNFGLLMESQSFYIFHSYFLFLFLCIYLVFFYNIWFIFKSWTLSSTYSVCWKGFKLYFIFDHKELCISRASIWWGFFFFSGFLYFYWIPLSCLALSFYFI